MERVHLGRNETSVCFTSPILYILLLFQAFYFYLGAVPVGVVITAANLFVGKKLMCDQKIAVYINQIEIRKRERQNLNFKPAGPAELADIPEGYEPKEWEYFRVKSVLSWLLHFVFVEITHI